MIVSGRGRRNERQDSNSKMIHLQNDTNEERKLIESSAKSCARVPNRQRLPVTVPSPFLHPRLHSLFPCQQIDSDQLDRPECERSENNESCIQMMSRQSVRGWPLSLLLSATSPRHVEHTECISYPPLSSSRPSCVRISPTRSDV